MAENKFIERLQGKDTEKAVLEIKKSNSKTSFANMTEGTSDATIVYSDSNNDATAVLKNAINWKVISRNLDLSTNVSGDGDDVVGYDEVAGISDTQGNNLWINSSYTVPAGGMVFTKNTKWVLKLCGDNLIENGGSSIGFTVIISLGNSNIITKTFTVSEQATFFCKELVIDFAESNSSVIRLAQSDKITLKLLSNSANASARIYQGMTTLTALQRRVDSDAVSSNTRTFDDMEEDVDDLLDNVDYLQGHIIVKSSTMPTASISLVGEVYQYTGATVYPYEHGYIYECVESSPGVYSWQRMDVQPGGSRGRFLSLWNCATGLAVTNPPISPYEYKAGDYFIVSNVSSGTNYKPTGTEYVIGTASTVVESSEVFVDDTYFFDGTTWKLQNTSNDIKALVDTKVNKDGTSVMTGPLKFRAGSFVGAIAGGLGDGISFYKLKSDNTIDSEVASLTKTNGFLPGTTNSTNIGSSSLKWKDAYIARVITAVLNNGGNIAVPNDTGTIALTKNIKDGTLTITQGGQTKGTFSANQDTNTTIDIDAVNTDLSNLSSVGKNIANWSSNVTNCIVEIPQDIKLTLASGTLTLKSGSKLTYPDGTHVTTSADETIATSQSTDGEYLLVKHKNGGAAVFLKSLCYSGTTAPTGFSGNALWFDTTNNIIKNSYDSGATWSNDWSFPVCIVTSTSNSYTTIDQVFNGFGYIGSTLFALPDVKGLIPNGRNADGTLKNISVTNGAVRTITVSNNGKSLYLFRNSSVQEFASSYSVDYNNTGAARNYCLSTNTIESASGAVYSDRFFAGFVTVQNLKIVSFVPKLAFQAADYSEAVLKDYPQQIDGQKTITSSLIYKAPNKIDGSDHYNIAVSMRDSDGTHMGYLREYFSAAGGSFIGLQATRVISGTTKYAEVSVGFDGSNNAYAIAPTPGTTDNSHKIATTKWVRDLFSGGFGNPDYSSLVDNISNPYTPTVNGYIIAQRSGTYGNIWVKNNTDDVQIAAINCTDSNSSTQIVMVIANKGVEYSFSPSNATAKFVPAKGE